MKAVNPSAVSCPYLVGDLYFTERLGNPETFWPGTSWEQITDCFIRAADGSHAPGSTGGSWTHTQTKEEMPNHLHTWATQNKSGQTQSWDAWTWQANSTQAANPPKTSTAYTTSTGGGQPMDITNKFRCAYIWKRTA